MIARRQKLIKLADRSEHGWKIVKFNIQTNNDDEKHIAKAEKAAEKWATQAATKRKRASVVKSPAAATPAKAVPFQHRCYQQSPWVGKGHGWVKGGFLCQEVELGDQSVLASIVEPWDMCSIAVQS